MSVTLVFFNFFIWSTSFSNGKKALECSAPLFLTGSRMLLAGLIILGFVAFVQPSKLRIKKAHYFPLILLALTSVYLSNAFEYWGLQYLTAAKTSFIYSLSPFLSALFSYFQFKEKFTLKKILGLGIGFLGFIPVFLTQSTAEELAGGISILSWPEISLICAVITAMYGWVLLRKLGKEDGVSPLVANGASMMLGGIFALVHSFIMEGPLPVSDAAGFLKGIAILILISNLICYNIFGWLLKRFSATFLSFAGSVTPLFAAFFGWVMLGETVNWSFFVSIGITAFGLWLVYAEEIRLGYIFKKVVIEKT